MAYVSEPRVRAPSRGLRGLGAVAPIPNDEAELARIAAWTGEFQYSLRTAEQMAQFKAALNYLVSTPGHVGGALSIADLDSLEWDPRTNTAWQRFLTQDWSAVSVPNQVFGFSSEPGADARFTVPSLAGMQALAATAIAVANSESGGRYAQTHWPALWTWAMASALGKHISYVPPSAAQFAATGPEQPAPGPGPVVVPTDPGVIDDPAAPAPDDPSAPARLPASTLVLTGVSVVCLGLIAVALARR